MAFNFSELRKKRGNFEDLLKQVEKVTKPNEYKADERFWQPTVDKAGNGYAVIRLLPPPKGEDIAWTQIWSHGFQGPTGKWYIENSLTTLGQDDPVSAMNSELWNSGVESDKEIARKQKRKLNYISNIYVIKDPGNPDNEGKVFLWKYGKKIFDKISEAVNPEFADQEAINVFDFWDGAEMRLRIRKHEGYRNFDKTDFGPSKPLFDDDDKIEEVWNQQHSLTELVDPKHFKSYEELEKRLKYVLGKTAGTRPATDIRDEMEDHDVAEASEPRSAAPKASKAAPSSFDDDDDDLSSYFSGLVED
jgi:hypothetical protein